MPASEDLRVSPPVSAPATPRDAAPENPLTPEVKEWLIIVQKTLKTLRVYASNNSLLNQFLDDCHNRLTAILAKQPELTLYVREDRLNLDKDPVLIDSDRETGL